MENDREHDHDYESFYEVLRSLDSPSSDFYSHNSVGPLDHEETRKPDVELLYQPFTPIDSFPRPSVKSGNDAMEQFDTDSTNAQQDNYLRKVHMPTTILVPWSLQFGAVAVAISALVSLIALAVVYGNQPLSSWKTTMFSINGVVATLTTVMKASLGMAIADSISQGKWIWFSPSHGRQNNFVGNDLWDITLIDDASRGSWGSLRWLFKTKSYPYLVSSGAILTRI